MLDIKVLRERPEAAKAGAVKKHMPERADAVDRALAPISRRDSRMSS